MIFLAEILSMIGGRVVGVFCSRMEAVATSLMIWVLLQVAYAFVVQISSSPLYLSPDGRKVLGSSSSRLAIVQKELGLDIFCFYFLSQKLLAFSFLYILFYSLYFLCGLNRDQIGSIVGSFLLDLWIVESALHDKQTCLSGC